MGKILKFTPRAPKELPPEIELDPDFNAEDVAEAFKQTFTPEELEAIRKELNGEDDD